MASNRSSHAINLRTSAARHAMPILQVPPFRPIHPGDHNKPSRSVTRITKIRDDDPVTVVAVPAFAALPQSISKVASYNNNYVQNPNNRRISVSKRTTSGKSVLRIFLRLLYTIPMKFTKYRRSCSTVRQKYVIFNIFLSVLTIFL